MKFLKLALHWSGIVAAILAVPFCIDAVFDSAGDSDAFKTIALAVTSLACLHARKNLP